MAWCSFTALTCRDWTTAFKFADQAVQTANEQGFAFPGASGAVAHAAAQAMLEPGGAPLTEMSDGIDRHQQFGGSQLPYLLTLLAEVLLRHADWDGASQALSKAQDWMTKNGERTVAAEAHRLVGDLLAMSGRSDAEPHFLRALEVARAQKAQLFELRAASSLARLWRDQGRREEALTTLEPVYGGSPKALTCRISWTPAYCSKASSRRQMWPRWKAAGGLPKTWQTMAASLRVEPVVALNQRGSDRSGTARGSC